MCEVAFCGFIYYNVQYVMSIVGYITSKLQLALSYGIYYVCLICATTYVKLQFGCNTVFFFF